jgi:hypothetical protein
MIDAPSTTINAGSEPTYAASESIESASSVIRARTATIPRFVHAHGNQIDKRVDRVSLERRLVTKGRDAEVIDQLAALIVVDGASIASDGASIEASAV